MDEQLSPSDYTVVTRYDPTTGELGARRSGDWGSICAEPYHFVMGEWDSAEYWIPMGTWEACPRPHFPIQQNKVKIASTGEDFAVFKDIPPATVVAVAGGEHVVADGVFEFATLLPGVYIVTFRNWPYRDLTVEVTAE